MRNRLILLATVCLLGTANTKVSAQEAFGFGNNFGFVPIEANNGGLEAYAYSGLTVTKIGGSGGGSYIQLPPSEAAAAAATYSSVVTGSAILPFDYTPIPGVQNGLYNALNGNIQRFAGALDDSPLYYEGDNTVFSGKKKTLEKGTLAVDTGSKSTDIYTRIGKVHIKPDTTCEVKDNGENVRIAVIGGNANVIGDNGETMSVSPGEAFTVETGPEDLFIAAAGEGKAITGKIIFNGRQAEKRAFNVREYLQRDVTVAGVNLHLGLNHPAQKKRFREHITQAAGKEPTHTAQSRPVDIMGIVPLPIQSAYQPWLMTKGSVLSGIESNLVNLTSGSLFGQAPASLTVKTPLADISTSKGTVLAIETKAGSVRVKVCAGTGNTHVKTGQHKISLMPGHEALITQGKPSESEARPGDGIGRRRVKSYPLGEEKMITLADYDTLSFLLSSPYVQQLRSANTRDSKAVLDKMMKATAAISYVTGTKGHYYAEQ